MATTRFHKAAQDGNLDILKDATRKDCNTKDEDGMTPTLWAANSGNLEALRLLVGRGGDVEKCNYHFGQSALHLAASKGHMNCVSFLVGFEANLWALDHDLHTPLQVAHNKDIIDYLDKAQAKQTLTSKKEVKARKEKALKDAERRKKKYEEKIKKERDKEEKRIKKVEKQTGNKIDEVTPIPTSVPNNCVKKTVVEVTGPSFTEIVGGTVTKKPTTSVKKILEKKIRPAESKGENETKVSNQKNGSQIIYVNSYENNNATGKRGKLSDVFDTRTELIHAPGHQPGIFDRPGFGSVAFRQRVNLAGRLSGSPEDALCEREEEASSASSIGSAGSLAKRHYNKQRQMEDDITTSDEETVICGARTGWSSLRRFLVSAGVEDYAPALLDQRIDLEALLMLSEQDLVQLGFPMGPRKKLLHAVEQRKLALKNPGILQDSKV